MAMALLVFIPYINTERKYWIVDIILYNQASGFDELGSFVLIFTIL